MERHHRDFLTAVAAVILGLLALLGWGLFSRLRGEPPLVIAEARTHGTAPAARSNQPASDPLAPSAGARSQPAQLPAMLRVHVVGAVRKSAVYTLPRDARVIDALKQAGGATADADLESINLADFVKDGEQVRIPRKSERRRAPAIAAAPAVAPSLPAARDSHQAARSAAAPPASPPPNSYHRAGRYPNRTAGAATGAAPAAAPRSSGKSAKAASNVVVNLNTATAAELDSLPGVGPATAAKILEYRQQHGPFLRIQDIMEVKGIGPKKFEKMKDRLAVR